ncbi:YiiX/YebB-like N1pC/P60 family cysteine hydrolase [Haloferula sp.]|uniref:YiiX/YebB-like N1pC/P60 family cysteine hydrolase n=1 Tax=Haloferula sp. TaxID=2497595 RepID=UPI00329B2EC1
MNAAENERMEFLLFRFVTAQDVLSDMVGSLGGKHSNSLFPDETLQTAAHVLVTDAELLLIHHRAELVARYADDPVAIAKMNEAFYRSEIPAGSYERFRLSVTSPDVGPRIEAAWSHFSEDDKSLRIKDLKNSNPEYGQLVKQLPDDYKKAVTSLEKFKDDGLTAAVVHSEVAGLTRGAKDDWAKTSYKARSLLFKNVSRIKNPAIKVLTFSKAQHAEVKRLLQPGDIILTYTGGYMSDVFIPGSFKHGITYIGSPAQRRAAGLDAASLPKTASRRARNVAADLDHARLSSGEDADVIEAVAEGVIFNSLGFLMDTHVSRMAVLRPKFNPQDRAGFLGEVCSYHGSEYDFMFDFGDASRQVCTEVIWRGINGRAGIDLSLTKRGGHPTLSADDLVNYHFETGGKHFEFVLFAEGSGSGRRAVIHTGTKGEEKLRRQMDE